MRSRGQLWLAAGLVAAWLLLTGSDPASFMIALPVIAAALYAARRLSNATGAALSLTGVLGFIPFFLAESLRGGWNVATATLSPRMRLTPTMIDYSIDLEDERSLLLFANCVSLLPGTLAADLDDRRLLVHVLDDSATARKELKRLERRIGKIFPAAAAGERS
ncbi:MAG: Na+/H+ antiporter subunit E [Gammaproteobacteria bacterium]|jgi:multicomponent Na+:H+ antiporter subunit E